MELATTGSAVRHASVARHVTNCATRPGIKGLCQTPWVDLGVGSKRQNSTFLEHDQVTYKIYGSALSQQVTTRLQ